jgi:hypothetical protein
VSDAPEGTKPWRKAWRRRWREGSSFRGIGLPAKLIVIWVEENADDSGTALVTLRQLSRYLSGPHHKQTVPLTTTHRALHEAIRAGLLVAEAERPWIEKRNGSPSRITRVKFATYQHEPAGSGTGTGTPLDREAEHSSRRRQKKQREETEETPGDKRRPASSPLFGPTRLRLETVFEEVMGAGAKYLFAYGRDGAALKRLLASATPAEIDLRWRSALRHKGYPTVRTVAQLAQFWNSTEVDRDEARWSNAIARAEAELGGSGNGSDGRDPSAENGLPSDGAAVSAPSAETVERRRATW